MNDTSNIPATLSDGKKDKPKYITLGPLDGKHLQAFLNEFAKDGYTLDKFSADSDGHMYAVMVREP